MNRRRNLLWFIYALKDPRTEEIKYVGRTQQPERRLAWHLFSPTNPELVMWLFELQQSGLKPVLEILETLGISRAEAEYQEVYWIRKHAGKQLLNHYYNVKNTKATKHKRKPFKISLPAELFERLQSEAEELGMGLTTYVTMRLSGYVSEPLPALPDEKDAHPNSDPTGFFK